MMRQQNEQVDYEVERIHDKGFNSRQNRWYYLVQWRGYDLSQATWEPIKHLEYIMQQVHQFDAEYDEAMLGKYPHGILPFWIQKKPSQINKRKPISQKQKISQTQSTIRSQKFTNQAPKIENLLQNCQSIKLEAEFLNPICYNNVNQNNQTTTEKALKTYKNELSMQVNLPFLKINGQILGARHKNKNNNNNVSSVLQNIYHNDLQFLFYDFNQKKTSWITRLTALQFYPVELNLFYEKNIRFFKKENS